MMTLLPYLALSPAIGLVLLVIYMAIITWRSFLVALGIFICGVGITASFVWGITQLLQ